MSGVFSWLSPRNRDADNSPLKKCLEEKEAEVKKREEAEKENEELRKELEAKAKEYEELEGKLKDGQPEGEEAVSKNDQQLYEELENARIEMKKLKKDLEEEQKERASLLARVNGGGGVKKKSLVASILQWDKENPDGIPEEITSPRGNEEEKNKEEKPAETTEKPAVKSPRPSFVKRRSTMLWGKATTGSRVEVERKKTHETPQDFIEQLKQVGRLSLTFLKKLDKKLHTVDSCWLVDFIAEGGFTAIIEAENYIEQVKNKKLSDAVIQINLVLCIRSLFNNEATLDVVTKDHSFVKTLVHTTSGTKNVLMKAKLVELFSALCLYSDDGYDAVVDAFETLHPTKSRYAVIVRMVSQEPDTQFRRAGVSLINALILGKSNFIERTTVRKEFIREGLVNALHIVEADNSLDPDEPLSRQLAVFQGAWDTDHEEEVWNLCFNILYRCVSLFLPPSF